MSLRSVGNQLLQTAPSPLLAGASTASLSLWVRVNPDCNVANPGGVNIFGDAGGKVSATLGGSGSLQLGWSSNDGTTNDQSTCNLTLAPGTSYHLAATWQAGSQRYFLNGVEVDSDTRPGTLGVLGDAAPHPFRLGSDSAGTDVTLDEPTLWVGHALSAQDVRNLRDRIVHPEGIAPASIALEWSLAGADGVAAQVGDAGLADSSATGLNLSSVVGSAPTYQAGVLSYAPAAAIGSATVAPSGRSIIVVVEDGTGAPANLKSLKPADNVQQLSLVGAPAGGGFTLSFAGRTTATIPVVVGPPLNSGTWTIAGLTPGRPARVASAWDGTTSASTGQLLEFFDSDGTTPLGSISCDMTRNSAGFVDGVKGDGQDQGWQPLGTFTPAGSSLAVRATAPAGAVISADSMRVQDTVTGAVRYLDDQTPGAFAWSLADSSAVAATGQEHWYAGTYSQAVGTGVGDRTTIDPATIQAALTALPSVGAGGASVTAAGKSDAGPYTVTLGGPLGGGRQPSLVSSDPAVSVATLNPGGDFPSISINGGAPILLKSPVWGPGLPDGATGQQVPPYLPYVMWPLPQAAPATRIGTALSGYFRLTGGLNYGVPGYSNPTALLTGAGTGTFLFSCLPPASYRVAVTWPASAGQSSVTYTVTDNAGNTLATVAVDQTAAPADFADAGVGWKVLGTFAAATNTDLAVSSTAAGGSVTMDAARLDRVGPDTSIVIAPADVVTFSASEGWALTAAGPVDGATSLPLANLAGGSSLPPFDPTGVTMPVGYNVGGDNPFGTVLVYANMAKRVQWGGGFTATDADGYPTVLTGPHVDVLVAGSATDDGGLGKGLASVPNGTYTFMWDGASVVTPSGGADTTSTPVSSSLTGTTDNTCVYQFANGPSSLSPGINFRLSGTAPDPANPTGTRSLCDFRNLRIYPPGVDPADPPVFHPSFLSKLRGVQSLRFLDTLATNSGNVHDYTDLIDDRRIDYFDARTVTVPVASVAGYVGPASGFDASAFVVIQITTSAPHGLNTGQYATLVDTGNASLSNGSSFYLGYSGSVVQAISPTVVLMGLVGDTNHPNRTMTNTVSGAAAGQLQYQIGGGGMTFVDGVGLCNAAGADLYLNVGPEWSDDCVTRAAAYIGANLKAGLRVRVEYANECWNFGFPAYASCCLKSVAVLGKGYNYFVPYYVYRMKQVHDLFATALTAAGRAGDLIRVMGTQGGYTGLTAGLVAYARQYGAAIDEVAVAPYLDNQSVFNGQEPTLTPAYNLMTVDQNLDLFELNVLYGGLGTYVSGHRAILDAAGYTSARIICYEGGPDQGIPFSSTADFKQRSRHAVRHPRMYGVMLAFLKMLQDAGASLFNDYLLNGGIQGAQWSAYYGWNMQPGTGNPATDAINISNPEAVDQIKSEVGGAIGAWASLVKGPAPPPRPPAPRNIKLKAVGNPKTW